MNANAFKRLRHQRVDHRSRAMRGYFAFRDSAPRHPSISHGTGSYFSAVTSRFRTIDTSQLASTNTFAGAGASQIAIAGSTG